MSQTKIIQYTHRPNATELGIGNTHETYMLISKENDLSDIFPIGKDVSVEDTKTHKKYSLKSANQREFRVNQMGDIYRDNKATPGDEIIITQVTKGGNSKTFVTVNKFDRVVISVSKNGAEVTNKERLGLDENDEVSITTYDKGSSNSLKFQFDSKKPKRSDSPDLTDYYKITYNNAILANGTYYLTFGKFASIVSLPKSSYSEVEFEDSLVNLPTNYKADSLQNDISSPFRPYITAIKSKPFLLLAGISGTGKSRIVRELARSCWAPDSEEYKAQKPKNFEMIQVKPNWHDSSELIGYVSRINGERFVVGPFLKFMTKAMQDPEHPYFLCLDEMNLAPVEQYFAEYLSVLESRKLKDGAITTDPIIDYECTDAYHDLINQLFDDDDERKQYLLKDGGKRLTIPQNLIVVGTVNMDETTFSFSRKVLDRAMTIEMNDVDLYGGLTSHHEAIGRQSVETLVGTAVEGVDVYESNKDVCDKCLEFLGKINAQLEGTPFKVAYRTRNEFLLYVVNNLPYTKDADGSELSQEYVMARALDEITNMKVLSRIEGDESKVSAEFLGRLKATISDGLTAISSLRYADRAKASAESGVADTEKSISLAKLSEMTKKLESGYTSFWS